MNSSQLKKEQICELKIKICNLEVINKLRTSEQEDPNDKKSNFKAHRQFKLIKKFKIFKWLIKFWKQFNTNKYLMDKWTINQILLRKIERENDKSKKKNNKIRQNWRAITPCK